jgi:hypothetical protein
MDDKDVLEAAEAALREGRAGEAQRLLHGLVERDPGNGRAWYMLSVLTTIDSQREMYLAKALVAGFDPAPAPAIVEQPPAEDDPAEDEVIVAARAALAQERMGEVRRLLMPLVERDPQHGEAWFVLSQASSLDSQRLLYWQRAWDAGYKHLLPAPRSSAGRPTQPLGPRYRAPLDEPPPLFAHERQHRQPYYSPPPGQAKAVPDGAGDAFFKGGCFLVLGMLALGVCALIAGGGFAIDLGGIACLFVIGGVLGVIIYSLRGR